MRRNRSRLPSGLAVYGAARRARHLRAQRIPLFAMHPQPASLLSTPRFWRTLFCQELYHAAIMPVINSCRRPKSSSFQVTDELTFAAKLLKGGKS